MATSDKLNQVGKSIRQTRDDSQAALRRYSENFPKIESTRDAFSSGEGGESPIDAQDFVMYFKTSRNDNRILLDLVFLTPFCPDCNNPPPN